MKKYFFTDSWRPGILPALFAVMLLLPQAGFAATTGTTAIYRQIGSGAQTASGDYISSNQGSGLDTYYGYFIEVPPNTARLTVEIWDKDIGAVANYTDWQIGGGYNTDCRYRLWDPAGTNVINILASDTPSGDSVWTQLYSVANPAAGHWELRVVMRSSFTTGDDVNGYGIRAHDGTSGAGGTELNIYAQSFVPLGAVGATGANITTTFYPFITSGCTADWNDFDADSQAVLSYRSRVGTVSGSYTGAANDAWQNLPISGYSTNFLEVDSGIWTATANYTVLGSGDPLGNFGVFWAGNWLAANGAPTAQPQANSFRVYLPTDAGAAPSKPVFSQKLSYISGSQPPAVLSTTRIRVELIIFNPTAQAITFSATNQVTAYIPGGGVVSTGIATASHGTFSVPGAGGTGAVTWNPGSVAGNNTYATFYYEINVTPPDGNRLPVTGTPTANGSTARYVDETGNTTQTRATYTYGPLCELAVTAGSPDIPTWVAISCFEADMSSGRPGVEWHTTAENGTAGFYLWRQDGESQEYRLVNPEFLPSLPNAMTGGIYRLADPYAQYGETTVYRLEEIDVHGRSQIYGPFTVTFDSTSVSTQRNDEFYGRGRRDVPTELAGFQRAASTSSQYEKSRLQARSNALRSQPANARAASQNSGRAKITIGDRGLYFVSQASIASALNRTPAQVEGLIASHFLYLSCQGQAVAWLAAENNGGIYFYGEKLESPYSDRNVYWLEPGIGLGFEAVSGGNATADLSSQTFTASSHFEEDKLPLTSLFYNPEDDFWLWDMVIAGSEVKIFPIWVSSPAMAGMAELTVNLHGGSDTNAPSEHHLQFFLNKNPVGETWWDGLEPHTCRFPISQSIIVDGTNTLVVSAILDGGVKYSYAYVDSIDLSYQQYYHVTNNILWCRGDSNQVISVSGFTDSRIMVLDISQPKFPKRIETAAIDPNGRITFVPSAPDSQYLVIGLSAARLPLAVQASATTVDLKSNPVLAEYVLIAPSDLVEVSRQLAEHRRSLGLDAEVVSLEDIYDSFNWGLASPLAIKDFLAAHFLPLMGEGLKYAVLVGRGTFDYKNHLGCGDNLVPPMLASTPDGLFAADNQYGDLKGFDGIPEIAIGRLPVVSADELRVLIAKIIGYGSSGGAWTDRALLIADNDDYGGDFYAASENLGQALVGYGLDRVTLLGKSNASLSHAKIIDGFNSGRALVNYVGHAGLNQLAEENILSINDLKYLQNGERLPVMVFVTCAAGRFDIPGYACLGEGLLLKDNGGIVAALAPSSASINDQSKLLAEEFYKAAFSAKEKDLGMSWLRAALAFVQQGGRPEFLNVYNILGDPAVMFK